MIDPDKAPSAITTAIFIGLTASITIFEETLADLVAVIIIVASVAGLALNWLSNQYSPQKKGWREERGRWEEAERWW